MKKQSLTLSVSASPSEFKALGQLEDLEKQIEIGLTDYKGVKSEHRQKTGKLLRTIRDKKLFRAAGFKGFRAYIDKRWSLSKTVAYELIKESDEPKKKVSRKADTSNEDKLIRRLQGTLTLLQKSTDLELTEEHGDYLRNLIWECQTLIDAHGLCRYSDGTEYPFDSPRELPPEAEEPVELPAALVTGGDHVTDKPVVINTPKRKPVFTSAAPFVSQKTEGKDCTVKAIEAAFDVSYSHAHRIAAHFGRKPRHGTGELWDKMYDQICQSSLIPIPKKPRYRVSTFAQEHPKGTYILYVYDHVLVSKQGQLIGDHGIDQWIKGYWSCDKGIAPDFAEVKELAA